MKGCFNKANEWYQVESQLFVSAMQQPGGGRSLPSARLLRHFNIFYVPEFDSPTLNRIFTSVLEWGLTAYCDEWRQNIQLITAETIQLFNRVS
jgi:P-loop containing dynein motor region